MFFGEATQTISKVDSQGKEISNRKMKSLYNLRRYGWYSFLYTDENNGETDVGFFDKSGSYSKNGDKWIKTIPSGIPGMRPWYLSIIKEINSNAEKFSNVKKDANSFTAQCPEVVEPIISRHFGIDVKEEKINSCTISLKRKPENANEFTIIEQVYKTENLKTGEKMTTTVTTDMRPYQLPDEKFFLPDDVISEMKEYFESNIKDNYITE